MSDEAKPSSLPEAADPAPAKVPKTYFQQTKDLANSLVLVLPVMLIYEFGLLVTDGKTMNGVDFITVILASQWGIAGILVFNGLLILAGLGGLFYLVKKREFRPKLAILGVLIESTVYALFMGSLILFIMRHLPGFSGGLQTGPGGMGLFARIFLSMGAGVNEELVFRLGMFSGLAWSLGKFVPKTPAAAVAVIVSSVLFSLAHYVGPESFQMGSFVFRFLAGALFCVLFLVRGFAVAVYTHAIYDIYVLVGQWITS